MSLKGAGQGQGPQKSKQGTQLFVMAYEIGTQITCEYNILALKKASTAEANFENFYIVSNSSDIVGQCVPRRPGPTIQPRAFQLIFKVAQSLRKYVFCDKFFIIC